MSREIVTNVYEIHSQIFTINPAKGLFTHLDNIPSKTSVISNPSSQLKYWNDARKAQGKYNFPIIPRQWVVPKGHVPLSSFHFQPTT